MANTVRSEVPPRGGERPVPSGALERGAEAGAPGGAAPSRLWLVALVASLALHIAVCAAMSSRKPLWFDELFTYYVAQLPDAASIVGALRSGMDNNPPVSYLLSHYAMALVGEGPFGVRLPYVVGVWIGLVSLYLFVAARAPREAGACAALIVASSVVMPFACEARAYALTFGGACASLRIWQRALGPDRGRLPPILLFVALSATLWTHYYAMVVLVPFVLAEGLRAFDRRAIDWPVALALLGAALNVAPLYWFVSASNVGFSQHFWVQPGNPGHIVQVYETLLAGLWLPGCAILVVLLVTLAWSRRRATLIPPPPGAARWELVAALAFLAIPCVTWVLAKLVIHAYYYKYCLLTLVGVGVLFGRGVALASRPAQRLAVALLVALLPFTLTKQARQWSKSTASADAFVAYATRLADREGLPVVFDDKVELLLVRHRAEATVAPWFFGLTDVEAELRLLGYDSNARALEGLQRFRDVNVRDAASFLAAHRRFVLVSRLGQEAMFTLPRLLEEPGARVELISLEPPRSAYLVTLPGATSTVGLR